MIDIMPGHPLGSIWSVLGLEDAAVVIVAGPFAAARGVPEYLVAPLYGDRQPGFIWTAEDVRLEPKETGLPEARYAAIWNARPALEADLLFPLGQLSEDATVAVRDVYWASLNERPLGKSPRLGRSIKSADDPAARFQAAELDRWEPVSGRVFTTREETAATGYFSADHPWQLLFEDMDWLWERIEESEEVIGASGVELIGPSNASLFTNITLGWTLPDTDYLADLFSAPIGEDSVHVGFLAQAGLEPESPGHSLESLSELARAA